MKFNIKVERVRSRWFHRKETKIEKVRRNIDDMFETWNKQMEEQHALFNKMLDEIQNSK